MMRFLFWLINRECSDTKAVEYNQQFFSFKEIGVSRGFSVLSAKLKKGVTKNNVEQVQKTEAGKSLLTRVPKKCNNK